ncbi:MAG: Phthiodiolone/phenolphthiodiolone dimycocerosates ketoreductase [Alphaproteobacteria bacterium MarineAlpha12_Bin1]|jgi:alkanesulfonate monooxygenase SsuD/methylene tetrahydromethanopterin reductase-like flavin-dependent oxidoreductase (luciferase family)|nr:MAG: Phthiodiolone/phenolphthiodiolone dimycocerosates ketoreductase [Alphaproteobacteria bacterium MarineAlpha12_Bin1]|tara:strand:+ start:13837 stop:14868 length:1032 start_codon:yes stop_codon:yes gene_type:complete
MKFGLFGSAQAKRGGSPDVDSAKGYRDWLEFNIEAEALGYHSAFAVEHHFTGFGQVSATINLLTFLAAETSTLRLGTAVMVLPWHNPVLLAEQAATLDLLSGGRLDFGVGKGYRYNEFDGFNIPMEEAGDRFEESLDVLTRAWTTDEPWSHQGKYWSFNDIIVEPPTIQKPHPPFWMGAGSPNSIEGVVERGYNLLLDQFAPISVTLERMQTFRTAVENRGRKFDANEVGVARGLYVARDEADRDEAIQRRISARTRIDNLAQRPDGANKASIMSYDDTTETALEASLFGTVEEIVEKVSKLRDGGVKYILLSDGGSGIEGLRQFSKEVMPVFAGDEKAEAAE